MKYIFLISALLITTFAGAEEVEPVVWAHLEGTSNFVRVDTNVVVSAQDQTVFHAHADFDDGGGIWYNVSLSLKEGTVTILERDSVSQRRQVGNKVETKEKIYHIPVEQIKGELIRLKSGNRITLTVGNETPPPIAAVSSPEPIDLIRIEAGGKITLNGTVVDVEKISGKIKHSSVIISADSSIPYKRVSAVLAETAEAGVKNVSLVTSAESEPEPEPEPEAESEPEPEPEHPSQ